MFLWVTGNTGKRKGTGNRRLSLAPLAGDGLDSLCGGKGDTHLYGGRWQHFLEVLLKGAKLVTSLA